MFKARVFKTETVTYQCNGKTSRPGDGMFQGLVSLLVMVLVNALALRNSPRGAGLFVS